MNIIVLNGSPKGINGITAQYTRFLELSFPDHSFETIEVGRKIRRLERDPAFLDAIVQQLTQADAILWSFPVYFMLVPAQLKRFIELMFDAPGAKLLAGKPATALSSSAHFYDHTAHDYLHGVCQDLGLRYFRGYSAEMKDLFSEQERRHLLGFAKDFFHQALDPLPAIDTSWPPIRWAAPPLSQLALPPPVPKTGDKHIVLVSDAGREDHNLRWMIEAFDRSTSHPMERIDLHQLALKGGCLGCMRCSHDAICIYEDDYARVFTQKMVPADVILYAGVVHDRYLSARFKTFIDRYFVNGHRSAVNAGAFGVLISGPLSRLEPLRESLEATVQLHCQHRLGMISDEHPDPAVTAAQIQGLAGALERWAEIPWHRPATFLGVGGQKVFRDIVYENKGVMSADHRYYRTQRLYDYPNTRVLQRGFNGLLLILRHIPWLKAPIEKLLRKGQMRPYHQLLNEL